MSSATAHCNAGALATAPPPRPAARRGTPARQPPSCRSCHECCARCAAQYSCIASCHAWRCHLPSGTGEDKHGRLLGDTLPGRHAACAGMYTHRAAGASLAASCAGKARDIVRESLCHTETPGVLWFLNLLEARRSSTACMYTRPPPQTCGLAVMSRAARRSGS